ncbi:MAG: homocysteine S-methyltransferase family protein [Ignavibacteriaceae bacterium]|nr:homocysteine S-methyltransferase family protein [Ignavibacteriaceae bacterium]
MNFNLFTFARKINRPLLLDGAMGSLLQQKGVKSEGKLWTALANIQKPNLVLSIHKSYIKAGADIITTNTFRTNPVAVKTQSKINFKEFVLESVKLAKNAAKGNNVIIAGSNAPAEDCYQINRTVSKKELKYNHKHHIDELMKNGCDFILNETQSHFDEIKIICDYCYRENIPYVLSLLIDNKMNILSGENSLEVIRFIKNRNPICIGFNCMPLSVFDKLSNHIRINFNWGLYLNLGLEGNFGGKIVSSVSPDAYASFIEKYVVKKPSFIGSCCGSNPNHIKKIKAMLDAKFSN